LSKDQWDEMEKIYTLAHNKSKDSGINFEVDHIIPIKSDFVCGLHVPWNLQIITEFENISKHNKVKV
jgi:hypothetical protein